MILELIAMLCAGLFAGLLLGAVVPFALHTLRRLASGVAFLLRGLPRPGIL